MDLDSKKKLVDKIITSSTFSNKEVLKGLLDFIFRATEKGVNLKEIDIAFDYFKRKDSFVPGDDTIVRVNIHKLRQLLEKYYSGEGRDEITRLQIPKGAYITVFENEMKIEATEARFQSKNILVMLAVALACSLVGNVLFTYSALKKINTAHHPVWGIFQTSIKPICIILGDPFFYSKKDSSGKNLICRDLETNSMDDLKLKKDNSLQKSPYAYFSKNNVLPLPDIMAFFPGKNKNVQLQALSELNVDNLKNSNLIFIANINSFGFFNRYLEKSSIRLCLKPRGIKLINKKDTTLYAVPENVSEYYNDYSFMVKIPGQNNNVMVLIGDFHSSGNKGLTSFLLDDSRMKFLEESAIKKYGSFPDYFEMIVKVSSYHYSDVIPEIVYFNKLEFDEGNKFLVPEMMN